jgi:recombination protein RecA
MATVPDREKALGLALAQIDKQFGKGSVMRLGERPAVPMAVIPTGSIALDVALGIGGLPRGRIVEIFGPESSGKTTVALHAVANAQKSGGIAAFIDAEHALDPDYAQALGVDTDALLVSQPDTGEQALEITDMLIRSGALDLIVIDSVAALVPRAEIEGEMGDSHVGLQARLMSQALRKITGALNNSGTTAIFINQLREKIGVMFGCGSWNTRVTLSNGTQLPIGKIVDRKLPVEVLSYDPELGRIVPRKVVNWFNNGRTEEFLEFKVERAGAGTGRGRARMALTSNHLVRTPGGWREAGELAVGDRVMLAQSHTLSPAQWQIILGSLMGDGCLSAPVRAEADSARFRMGHGEQQAEYLEWKVSLLGNVQHIRTINEKGAVFADFTPLPELGELRRAIYLGDGRKHFSEEFLKALSPLALAVWYMDDGCFTLRSQGRQERTRGGSGRIEICVEAMSAGTRERLADYLRDTYALSIKLTQRGSRRIWVLQFSTASTAKFQEIVAPYVHESMAYKLLPRFRGLCQVEPQFMDAVMQLVPATVLAVTPRRDFKKMDRYDIEVEGSHNYLADGVMVHNSPETTTGGRALKFYSSVRLDVRRIESLKDGTDTVGNRTRVKVVKNKCLAEGTTVFDPISGVSHRIEEIVDGRLPVSVVAAAKDGTLHTRPVVGWFDQGEQDVLGIGLRGGATLWATPDHKVLTDRGWKLAGELALGDRVAQPRQFQGFGDSLPYTTDEARKLAREKTIPVEMFAPDVSRDVVGNLLSGLLETDGYVSTEQTGAMRVGFTTTSQQLAHQIHWLLLRYGITSSVRAYDPTTQRPSLIKGRRVQGKHPCYEVRVTGSENVTAFADAIPLWGPRGQMLQSALSTATGRWRGSQAIYLADEVGASVFAHLADRGVTPTLAAQLIGPTAGDPRGGLRRVLGSRRLRRDRLRLLAEALDDPFLLDLVGDQVRYATVRELLPARKARTFDVEVDELHTFVANDVIVHNCAAPFKQAEFDIMYGKGISREGSLIDVGVEQSIIRKSGAWYTYEGDQLGQGKENSRNFLKENPDVSAEIEKKILEKLGVGMTSGDAAGMPPVDF